MLAESKFTTADVSELIHERGAVWQTQAYYGNRLVCTLVGYTRAVDNDGDRLRPVVHPKMSVTSSAIMRFYATDVVIIAYVLNADAVHLALGLNPVRLIGITT